jgi:hypothetical protein
MKSVIEQFLADVERIVPTVVYSRYFYAEEYGITTKAFTVGWTDSRHVMVATKGYRDDGCAIFRLVRSLEMVEWDRVSKLYWRLKPQVLDIVIPYPQWRGVARFTTLSKDCDPDYGERHERRNPVQSFKAQRQTPWSLWEDRRSIRIDSQC